MKRFLILFCTVLVAGFVACSKKPADTAASNTSVDRKPMLNNIGNNIIVPAYKTLLDKETAFDNQLQDFNNAPDAVKLTALQDAFKEVYKAWQSCSPFEIGIADQSSLNVNTNTFPTDVSKINNNISTGNADLSIAGNISAKGLPALDYLLFGDNNSNLLTLFTTDSKAANRKAYLASISADLKKRCTDVFNAWTTGNYITTFINADGTDVGSSQGQLVNKMDYDFEILKNNKLGIPLGKQSMGTLLPEKSEAYYSGISAQLALLQLQAIQNIYLGRSAKGDGEGMDDYLIKVNAKYNGGSLNDAIKQQFDVAIGKLQQVADPMSATIQNNTASVNSAYVEIQKLLVLLKTDMPSSTGILITYSDNDGD